MEVFVLSMYNYLCRLIFM